MPLLRNVNDKDWKYADNSGDFETGGSVYKQQEWGKNCVMFAFSKVLGKSTGTLAKEIVDGHIGGVERIEDMENSSVIKRVLIAYRFTPVIEGGAKWATLRTSIRSKAPRRLYATYWRNKQAEDWTDKEVKPGKSDHAFTILSYSTCILLPMTNNSTFDNGHPTDTDWISAWVPPAGEGVEADKSFTVVGKGFRRLGYA